MSTATDVERPRFDHPRSFQAAHSGRCATCGIDFDAGELIERSEHGYAHETCPENTKPVGVQCTECFTARSLSGACECTG